MSVFGTSRFTALLAAVALSGTAGTFWWALETRSDLKAAADNRAVSRSVPAKAGGRVSHSKDERPNKFEANKFEANKYEPNKFELMGKSERPQSSPAGRSEDVEQATIRPMAPRLANYPSPNSQIRGKDRRRARFADRACRHAPSDDAGKTDPAPAPWQLRAPDPLAFTPPIPTPAISNTCSTAACGNSQAPDPRAEA